MISSVRALAVTLLLTIVAAGPASAWNPAARIRMFDEALRLSPPALGKLLAGQKAECRQAAVDGPDGSEGTHVWTTPAGREAAGRSLQKAARDTIRGVKTHRPIAEICRSAGQVAHLVADLNDPSRTGMPPSGPLNPAVLDEFDRYAESVAARVPLVFWGWRDDLSSLESIAPLAGEIADRSARDAAGLQAAFYPEGRRVPATTFDDRSVPFAVASLSFSRVVSDTANILYLVWKESGGDLAGTPYRQAAVSRAITNEDLH